MAVLQFVIRRGEGCWVYPKEWRVIKRQWTVSPDEGIKTYDVIEQTIEPDKAIAIRMEL